MMAQVDISRHLSDDTIFNKISKRFISMDPEDMKNNNKFLKLILEKLIVAMRRECPLFDKTFQEIMWAGSYYKGTRFGVPEEYDLNFIINLPIKKIDIQRTDRPGYVKIHTNWRKEDTPNLSPKVYRKLNSLIDDKSYLNQEKFRTWIEGILSRVANATGGRNTIVLDDYPPIKIKKSGPAFTLKFKFSNEKTIDIDVVPVLTFLIRDTPPPRCSKIDILNSQPNKHWSVVPKPLSAGNFSDPLHRYWRLCFYEFEKDLLCNHDYGRMKPVIRLLKKLKTTQNWNSVASYYLETLCYHEKEMFDIHQRTSYTRLFFTMLEKLHDAFQNGRITYYWDDDANLLQNIGRDELTNMERRLNYILTKIKRTVQDDRYAIAKWVLNENELNELKTLEDLPEIRSQLERSDDLSQRNCVIV